MPFNCRKLSFRPFLSLFKSRENNFCKNFSFNHTIIFNFYLSTILFVAKTSLIKFSKSNSPYDLEIDFLILETYNRPCAIENNNFSPRQRL